MLVIGIVFIAFIVISIIIMLACCKVSSEASRWEEQYWEQINQDYEKWKKQREEELNNSSRMEQDS